MTVLLKNILLQLLSGCVCLCRQWDRTFYAFELKYCFEVDNVKVFLIFLGWGIQSEVLFF